MILFLVGIGLCSTSANTTQDTEMKAARTETITVRIESAVKAGLMAMAQKERRSIQYD